MDPVEIYIIYTVLMMFAMLIAILHLSIKADKLKKENKRLKKRHPENLEDWDYL